MDKNVEKLNRYIREFLAGIIGGISFEEKYTEIFDFEEIEATQKEISYFEKIRTLLEKYSSDSDDLKKHSDFYISEKQLKERIASLVQ